MIKYKAGYKYQLVADCLTRTKVYPPSAITTPMICLGTDGTLLIHKYYAWDGCSGPTIDTKDTMHGGLVHDALYQLMREGHLHIRFKDAADRELQRLCREDGMSAFRAWYYYKAVSWFGKGSAKRQKEEIEKCK